MPHWRVRPHSQRRLRRFINGVITVLLAVPLTYCWCAGAVRSARVTTRPDGHEQEMIISSSAHETRVAILEDDRVAEIFIEPSARAESWATCTRAGFPKCCPACSRRSLTSVSSATAFSTSATSSPPSRSSTASTPTRMTRLRLRRGKPLTVGRARCLPRQAATAGPLLRAVVEADLQVRLAAATAIARRDPSPRSKSC